MVPRKDRTFKIHLWVLGCLATLILSACTGGSGVPVAFSSGLRAWVDQPPHDTTLPLAPYTLKAHARNTASGGVTQIAFLVNSVAVGTVTTNASEPLVYAELNWNPSVPGEYLIAAQAFGSGGSIVSDSVRVCVASGTQSQGACGANPHQAGITVTVPQQAQGPQQFKVSASPQPVFLGQCRQGEPQVVSFAGSVSDATGATEVDIHSFLQNASGSRQELFYVPMSPLGDNNFFAAYDLTKLDGKALGNQKGTLVFTMNLLDKDKKIFATSQEQSITVAPCTYQVAGGPVVTVPPQQPPQPPPQQPPEQPPLIITTEAPPEQPAPPQDTSGPTINKDYPSATTIYYTGYSKDCSPTSASVNAYVRDDSGVSSVILYWYWASSGSASSAYTVSVPDGAYTFYPDHGKDTIVYWFEAWDIYNNHSASSAFSIAVDECVPPPEPPKEIPTTEVPAPP
jgi:hypothetical protein